MSNRINLTLSANLNRLNLGARSHQLNTLVAGLGISTLRIRQDHREAMVDPMRAGEPVPVVVPYRGPVGVLTPTACAATTTAETVISGSSSSPEAAPAAFPGEARAEIRATARTAAAPPPVADGRKFRPDQHQRQQQPRCWRDRRRSAGRRTWAAAPWKSEVARRVAS